MKAQVREKVTFMGWKMVVGFAFVFLVFILKKESHRQQWVCSLLSFWETFLQVPLNTSFGLLPGDKLKL